MTDRELAGCGRLGQQADPPHMIQPPGCNYTPDEVGRMLGNRVVQPHYAAWLVRKALLNIGLIDAEAARQQHTADQATIAALRDELNLRAPSRDAERLDYIERTFSGMTNRERYLPVQMIWGTGCNGRTLREACDKYMKRDSEKGEE